MTRSTHPTIDSILQLKRFGEDAFSETQRELIRAFLQHPASAWTKQDAPQQEGDTPPRKRPRSAASGLAPLQPRTQPFAASASVANATICTPAPPKSHIHSSASSASVTSLTIASPSTTGSPSAAASPSTTLHPTTVSASSSSSPPPEASISPPPLCPLQQGLDLSESSSKLHIKERGLVASYSRIDDIDGFVKDVRGFLTQEDHFALPEDTSHQGTVFSLFVTARAQETMSKAAGKIAATVFVSLYANQHLPLATIEVWKKHSRKSGEEIRNLFKECRKLGRACQHVRRILGPGAILLLDNFSACGTKLLGPQDESVLLRCQKTLTSDTDFAEQEQRLREPIEKLLSIVTSGAAWRPNIPSAGVPRGPLTNVRSRRDIPGVSSFNRSQVQSTNDSTVPVENTDFCSDLPSWQCNAVAAAVAAIKDEQPAFSPPTSLLLLLWCFLGDSPVCVDALQRGGKAQFRWTTSGELEGLRPEQVGINDTISGLLQDTNQLGAAVRALLSSNLLILAKSKCDGLPAYTVDNRVKGQIIKSLSLEAKVQWKIQVLMLVAFVFPRPNISLDFRTWGHHLLPHLQHTLRETLSPDTSTDISNDAVFPRSARTDLCLALLAASELPGKWKDEALQNVRRLSEDKVDAFIKLSATYRESTRMRVNGNTSGSRTLLRTAKKRFADIPRDSHPLQAVHGSLNISEALNFVQEEDLNGAITQLRSWSPLNPNNPSKMELVVLVNAQTQLAKVLRYQGRFEEALEHLEKLHETTIQRSLFDDIRTDVAVELGNVLIETNTPEKAREILQSEMDTQVKKGRTDTAASKLLHLSIAETFMRQGEIETANNYYLSLSNPGPFANLCLSVGLARVAHGRFEWSAAIERWTGALKILATHFPRGNSHSGYTSLGILKSMHVALSKSKHVALSELEHSKLIQQTLEQVENIEATCAPHGCKHWIPGLNSYWIDSIGGPIVCQSVSP